MRARLFQVSEVLPQQASRLRRPGEVRGTVLGVQKRDKQTQPLRYIRIEFANRNRLLHADAMQHSQRGIGAEGRPARTHRIENAAEAEQVGAVIDGLAACLLGSHVFRRAGDGATLRQGGVVGRPRQAEIGDLDALDVVDQQDVGRLDVAMNQTLRVRRRQAGSHLDADAQDGPQLERSVAVQPLLQGQAGHVFHDEIGQAVGLVDAVNGDDVLVTDGGGGSTLAGEPPPRHQVVGQVRGQHLDRHQAMQRRIESLEHHAHAAPADDALHLVRPEPAFVRGGQRHEHDRRRSR